MPPGEFSSIRIVRAAQSIAELNEFANLVLGGSGQGGDVFLRTPSGTVVVSLTSSTRALTLGAAGSPGAITVFGSAGPIFNVNGSTGDMYLGAAGGQDGDLRIMNGNGIETIHLDGATGRARYAGGDCAEDFATTSSHEVEPGTVMIIDDDGGLRPSETPYDRRVAGIVSGAGGLAPGVVLGSRPSIEPRTPVALAGKVFCKVDATQRGIRVGDLLTSSKTFGHAMAATNSRKAFGAVIGKALRPLDEGLGLIPVLVALQ